MKIKPTIFFLFSMLFGSSAYAQSGDYKIGDFQFSLDFENQRANVMNGNERCDGKIHVSSELGNFSWLHSVRMITIDFSQALNGSCNNFSMSMILNRGDLFDAANGPVTIQAIAVMNFSQMRPTTIEKL